MATQPATPFKEKYYAKKFIEFNVSFVDEPYFN